MRSTFLIAVMLVLSLAVSGCSNSRAADQGTRKPAAGEMGDYSADADGSVSDEDADSARDEEGDSSKKTPSTGDGSVADTAKKATDRVTDDVESAADNVTDAADDVVEGAADTVKGAADTAENAVDKAAGGTGNGKTAEQ